METAAPHLLSWILFLPMLGALSLAFLPDRHRSFARLVAVTVSLADLALALLLLSRFEPGGGFQAVEKATWITRYDISYYLGVDGLGLSMILLGALLTPLALLSGSDGIRRHRPAFFAAVLFLETGMHGVFMSLDLVMFYLFWEAVLLPMFFIIGVWGGQRRIAAAVKFFIYTVAGSVLMLVGILLLYIDHQAVAGYGTFSLPTLLSVGPPREFQGLIFAFFFIAFAVKTPVFPFHSWLPDAYVEAPAAASVLLGGVLAKMGAYGFLRFCLPLFPDAVEAFAPAAVTLALAGVLYGSFLALAQNDLKRLIAYSSFSHVGFIALGIFVLRERALVGSAVQMVSHGLVTGALFLLAWNIERTRGTTLIEALGGGTGKNRWPIRALVFFSLAAMGLPGLSSFIGEFLILTGTFEYGLGTGLLAAAGVGLGALYFLRMLGRTVFGGGTGSSPPGPLSPGELAALVPLALAVIWIGLFPGWLVRLFREDFLRLLEGMGVM